TRPSESREDRFLGGVLRTDMLAHVCNDCGQFMGRDAGTKSQYMDCAFLLKEDPLRVARMDAFTSRVDDRAIIYINHRMRDIATRGHSDRLADRRRGRCEDN